MTAVCSASSINCCQKHFFILQFLKIGEFVTQYIAMAYGIRIMIIRTFKTHLRGYFPQIKVITNFVISKLFATHCLMSFDILLASFDSPVLAAARSSGVCILI